MIAIFGPDRCGKSTVSQHLLRMLPSHYYYHHTRPPMPAFDYFGRFLATASPRGIVDRLHWCEVAYANAYRDGSALNRYQWRILELMALTQGVEALLLTDDIENIRKRWSKKEMFPVEGQEKVLATYDRIAKETVIPVGRYTLRDLVHEDGVPTVTLRQIAQNEKRFIEKAGSDLLPPALGMGAHGGFVIVGEAPSVDYGKDGGVPAPWVYGKSSKWVWDALDAHRIDWGKGFYTNSSSFESPEHFKRYMAGAIQPQVIIAVGSVASKMVLSAGMDHYAVPHPAYIMRFQGDEGFDAWARDLTEWLEPWKSDASLVDPTRPLDKDR